MSEQLDPEGREPKGRTEHDRGLAGTLIRAAGARPEVG